jgi:hypothetical protein
MKSMSMVFGQRLSNGSEVAIILKAMGCEWTLEAHTQSKRPEWLPEDDYWFPRHEWTYQLLVPVDKVQAVEMFLQMVYDTDYMA